MSIEEFKKEFMIFCKIVFDNDVIINDISTKDKIAIINYTICNIVSSKCLLNIDRPINENYDIFANDIDCEMDELIHRLTFRNTKWQSNVEEFT